MSSNPAIVNPAPAGPIPEEQSASVNSADRTSDGRFAKNNKGGPGNPFNRQVAALRKALLNAVTPTVLEEIVAILIGKAKSGDLAAIKLLLSYTIGKPGAAVDPDTLDQQEWQMHQEAAVKPQQVDELMTSVPGATANAVAQIAWPCTAQQFMQPVIQGLRAAEAADSAAVEPAPSAREQAGAEAGAATAQSSQDRSEPPSPNRRIGNRPAERTPGRSSRPATPRPPNLPAYVDWEAEQRIMDILFPEDDPPPDDKRG
jgi:hypothetical protein